VPNFVKFTYAEYPYVPKHSHITPISDLSIG